MRHLLLVICSLFTLSSWSQMSDSFDDGDFTNNPVWVGSTSEFIVNANNELQLNGPSATSTSYLSTPHNLTVLDDMEWRCKINYSFSPSAGNGGLTYLTSTDADLSTNPDGIFFRIGETGSDDPIYLIERSGGTETPILTSTLGIVANSFEITIKIIYRSNGDWELYTDLAGGSAYQLDATANHTASILGQHLGVWLRYTSSNSTKMKYDDFYAGPIQVDNTPPNLNTVTPVSSTELKVLFDEGMDQTTGEDISNYSVDGGIGNPTLVQQDGSNLALFTLTFPTSFNVN